MPKIGISDAKYSKLALKHLAASNGIVLTQLLSDFVKHFDIEIQDIQTFTYIYIQYIYIYNHLH